MNLVLRHAWANILELFRQPGFWLPSVSLPALFFLFFGLSVAQNLPADAPVGAEVVLAPFMLFGVLAIMFFQFGVGIAEERRLPWERSLRVLPVSGPVRFAARVLTALVFSILAVLPVTLIAVVGTDIQLQPLQWPVWLAAVFAGAVPFGLMGITLGYAATPKAALPIANIGFLLLAFMGGLFIPVDLLPDLIARITPYMPTRHYLDFVLGAIGRGEDGAGWVRPGLYLVGWGLAFLAAAVFAYRRDEGVRYR